MRKKPLTLVEEIKPQSTEELIKQAESELLTLENELAEIPEKITQAVDDYEWSEAKTLKAWQREIADDIYLAKSKILQLRIKESEEKLLVAEAECNEAIKEFDTKGWAWAELRDKAQAALNEYTLATGSKLVLEQRLISAKAARIRVMEEYRDLMKAAIEAA
jgi:hypothetical protein